MTKLQGMVAIVTSAAEGIGRAIAWRLAQDGASVRLTGVQVDKGESEVQAMQAEGLEASFQTINVREPSQLGLMISSTVEQYGRLDILVNNAASLDIVGTAEETSAEEWARGFDVAVRALSLSSGEAVPHMRRVGGGSVVNISSVHGLLPSTRLTVYDTCKHAVIGLTRAMAIDFGPDNIRVNAVCPGFVVTEVNDESWRANKKDAAFAEMYYPLRRVGRPTDVAAAVSFLVSDEAAYVTGHALTVDGGLTIQLQNSVAARTREYLSMGETAPPLRTPSV